ncbi:hypothetical protein JCM31826_07870 [Thermaurantimonas aggregans]|uniref:SMP-30/Gluconolactonase/LRE-like region domain-containing protein n=1 Tax=Thermaurantimonas aggregans TaxID=2173829 RepID=A0A401XJU4_9FLAO|nr:DUF5074 domain-containing protein [Thermaurantimonas aggregans]MCX8148878.1 hypothetical protein [Thermaurantimonas aggregans]GCD77305.1 hypothetical protein JCM31826_07870 [Thermaurantimonas aggregans]
MTKNHVVAAAALAIVVAASCKKDDAIQLPEKLYQPGVLVVNEGPFGSGTGTLDFYDPQTKKLESDIYQKVNGVPIGNIFQSAYFDLSYGYLVANNSGAVRVVDANNLKLVGTLEDMASPRYAVRTGTLSVAISDWASGKVFFYQTPSFVKLAEVESGNGPERMYYQPSSNKLYVLNSGGFFTDSTITVINTTNFQVIRKIQVPYNPNAFAVDKDGKLWVICGGKKDFTNPANNTPGALVRINTSTDQVELTLSFPDAGKFPSNLTINRDRDVLYFVDDKYFGGVYRMNITANALPSDPVINRTAYALAIDDIRGDLYLGDAGNFNQAGKMIRYTVPSLTPVDSQQVGVIPGNFTFR